MERLKWYVKHARENIEIMKSKTVRPDVIELASGMCEDLDEIILHSSAEPNVTPTIYEKGVRDGIDQALEMATEQAAMLADLALEGLPENARNREAMEAALTSFSEKLRVTLTDLSLSLPMSDCNVFPARMNVELPAARSQDGSLCDPDQIAGTLEYYANSNRWPDRDIWAMREAARWIRACYLLCPYSTASAANGNDGGFT